VQLLDEVADKEVKLVLSQGEYGKFLVLMEEEVLLLLVRITEETGVVQVTYKPVDRDIQMEIIVAEELASIKNPRILH